MTPGKSLLHPLTTLRFFAAMLIVLHHAPSVFGERFAPTSLAVSQGVSFFFVLSGFILAYNYPNLASRKDVLMFYAARFARIWPVHIITGLTVMVFMAKAGTLPLTSIILLNALLLQAWVPLKDTFFALNAVSWTLSVELFFYACFPILIWRWKDHWHWKLLTAGLLALLMISLANYFSLPGWEHTGNGVGLDAIVYINPLARIFEFTLGIAAASIYRFVSQNNLPWSRVQATFVEFCMVIMAILTLRFCDSLNETLWIGGAGAVYMSHQGGSIVWSALILVFAFERGWISKVLSLPGAVLLGEISFSLYMVHTIVLRYFNQFSALIEMRPVLWFAGFWVVCLTISYALFIGIEQPVRLVILSFAKRHVKSERDVVFPPLFSILKPMVFSVGIVLSILVIGYWVKPQKIPTDLVAVPGPFVLPQATIAEATFDSRIFLEEFRICSIDRETAELTYVLRPLTRMQLANDHLGVHLMDQSKNIVASLDHTVDRGNLSLDENGYWTRKIQFPASSLKGVDQIGFLMYMDFKNPYPISGAKNTDWDGRRLIFPIPGNWQDVCDVRPLNG
jgi:peptidoglycan/LPS O-acetylase OafA/YrhL